jgi:hypothetical protein
MMLMEFRSFLGGTFEEFDEVLARLKKTKRRKRFDEYATDMDDIIVNSLNRMKKAAENDMELNRKRLPAIEKLKLLSEFLDILNRYR